MNIVRNPYLSSHVFTICLFLLITTWVYFYLTAYDLKDWWLENVLVFIFLISIWLAKKQFTFSNTSVIFIFFYLFLHMYGAHTAYTHNEFGELLKSHFQLSRNPYDRIVHFSFGFLMIYPLCDFLKTQYKLINKHLLIVANMVILSLASIFELIEWGVAATMDSATGETYVATQGDIWDAQKDIILATVGANLFLILYKTYCTISKRPYCFN